VPADASASVASASATTPASTSPAAQPSFATFPDVASLKADREFQRLLGGTPTPLSLCGVDAKSLFVFFDQVRAGSAAALASCIRAARTATR